MKQTATRLLEAAAILAILYLLTGCNAAEGLVQDSRAIMQAMSQ